LSRHLLLIATVLHLGYDSIAKYFVAENFQA